MSQATHSELECEHAEHAPIHSREDARQGEISGHVRIVLAASLILSLIAFTVLYALNV